MARRAMANSPYLIQNIQMSRALYMHLEYSKLNAVTFIWALASVLLTLTTSMADNTAHTRCERKKRRGEAVNQHQAHSHAHNCTAHLLKCAFGATPKTKMEENVN